MDILTLIEELELMGEGGEKWYTRIIPGFIGKSVMSAEEFFDLVHRLRSALPEEMSVANKVSRDRDRILQEAHEERAKILGASREQAQLLISNDEIVKQAEQRADEILDEARVDAQAVRAEAETWARGIVERLDNYVNRISATVDKTRKALLSEPAAVEESRLPIGEEE